MVARRRRATVVKVDLRESPLSIEEAVSHVQHPSAGGVDVFVGAVRSENDGRAVERLEYQAYVSMARSELERIAGAIESTMAGVRVAALHRLGSLVVGDIAVVCAASAPHRHEAFVACRALIEGIKRDVPIWKREWGPTGVAWVGWVDARCAHPDQHHEMPSITHPQRVG
jgi:molybdopterin synthase catalytic subunit